ncbi:hypothetical protein CVU37_00855 [candidate division BRC1 bacterium HGW-BRC1-1]|jgi:hypothetical protein|nr:MAG: hypothetical protein CVU37_00855 [candidate division BRC1 bacterium HGW-BRC1-1]
MDDTYQIKCPCCQTILIVERRSGKIVDERRPILEQSTGDRYQDALKKVQERGAVAEEKFQKFQKERGTKMDKLDALFNDALKRAEEEQSDDDDEKPRNPFDMD